MQIVDHRQQVFGKAADRVFLGVVAFALQAAAHVLGFGKRAQQTVLGIGQLRLDHCQALLGRRRCVVDQSRVIGRRRPGASRGTLVLVLDHAPYPIIRPIIFAV